MENSLNSLNVFDSNHEPYWIASTKDTSFPVLDREIKVDVAIIGGGIVGITSAYLLKKEGARVAVIEANQILKGTTGHTTAKITSQHDLIYDKLIKNMGKEKAKQYADANEYAIKFIEKLIYEKHIDCDFCHKPAYAYTLMDDYVKKVENEVIAASSLGINAVYDRSSQLPFEIKAAVKFENQAQFHPRKYLLALADTIPNDGSYIFEHTKAVDIQEEEHCTVLSDTGKKVIASKVIIASHFPFYDGFGLYFARMYAERSYILAAKIKEKFPEGMYINVEEPARSLRSQPNGEGEIILFGGEHHKTGHEDNTNIHYENLGKFANETYNVEKFLYRWSTQDCMTMDNVPYVGKLTEKTKNIFVATGFGKWGMTNGTVSAIILKDLITKGSNKWSEVYDTSRFNTASVPSFVTQNLDVAVNLVSGKLSSAPEAEEVQIKNGEAKIIKKSGEKMGAYRDENGKLHIVDITCTHLGCELVWNNAEKSWDCPCHGSRFNYDGDVIQSPAFNKLKHLGDGKNKKDANVF